MKKIIFNLLAVVLFTGSLMSVSSSNKLVNEDGRASDCARMARATVLALADAYGQDPNGVYFEYFLNHYNRLYLDCYNN